MRYLDNDLLNRIEEQGRRRVSRRGLFAGSLKLGAGGALALALSGTAIQFAAAQDDDDDEAVADDASAEDDGIGGGGRTETGGGGRRGGGGRQEEAAAASVGGGAPAASGDLPSTGVGPLGGDSQMPAVLGAAAVGAAAAAALVYRQTKAAESTDA